jgi:cellulose synthase/poly-beta-1,6-N-acetylglucosamine synthase-like glycosyltransferase
MHNIATLPGTNFVVWTHLIRTLNGWDEQALTEDSELTIRIYEKGYKIKYIPYALTYEQEPQEWRVWLKQRMRWVRGNNYVVAKFFKEIPKFKSKRLAFDILYTLLLYYVIVSGLSIVSIALPGPYTLVWVFAFFLFILEIFLAVSFDSEDSLKSIGLIVVMYFTYCQFWIFVVLKAVYVERFQKGKPFWDKTVRFDEKAK